MSAPTIDLYRSVPFTFERTDSGGVGDGLTLDGYAAVFGQASEIDSWEGTFIETIRAGAFKKSIRERTPVMQFDHGRHPLIGSIPIGAITDLGEDDRGLHVMGRITDNWLMQPVRDAIANETVNGMSFRFTVVRDEWRDNAGKVIQASELGELLWNPGERGPLERTLIELKVPELGPVVFPAYEGTSVGVRAAGIAADIRDDGQLRHQVRSALAAGQVATEQRDTDVPDDPGLRREIARAVLFPEISVDAPPVGHPSATEPGRGLTTDAPPTGHPSSTTEDAPLAVEHPSPTDRAARRRYARLAYVTRNGVGKEM